MDLELIRNVFLSTVLLTPIATSALMFGRRVQNEKTISAFALAGSWISLMAQLGSTIVFALTGANFGLTKHLTMFHHHFDFALQVNTLASLFGTLTLFCCVTVVHFSKQYLHRESGFRKFFGMLFILTEGMLLLSYSDNLLTFFVGWEFIGLASFVLIAFYKEQPVSVSNALKVFSVYKIGDLGLIFGMLWFQSLSVTIPHSASGILISDLAATSTIIPHHLPLAYLGCFGLLLAAMAKSAQFPFSFCLARAMEGPTPSSAIFYGALSVHAGVLLLAKLEPLWIHMDSFRITLVIVGAGSAALASGSSRAQSSIKGRLAMASVSQVGLIFVELGLGLWSFALYHTVAHALLRSTQILISPSVLSHYLRMKQSQQSFVIRSAKAIEQKLPTRFRATLWVLAQQDYIVESFLGTLYERIKRIASGRSFIKVTVFFSGIYALMVAIHYGLGHPLQIEFTLVFLALGFVISIFAVTCESTYFTRVQAVSASMLVCLAGLSYVQEIPRILIVGAAITVFIGYVLLTSMVPDCYRCTGKVYYLGMSSSHPTTTTALFMVAAVLIGVPPSPIFFLEDAFYSEILQLSLPLAVLLGMVQGLNAIALFKAVSYLNFGPSTQRILTSRAAESTLVSMKRVVSGH